MTIYHFANESLGPYFFENFRKIKEQGSRIKIVLVFSSSAYRKLLKCFPSYLKLLLKLRYKSNYIDIYDEIVISKNVNSHNFSLKINSQDLGFISGFNQIFSKDLISRFHNIVNFHPSLLPFYRGPVPVYWVLKNKESSTGFTFHFVTEKIDAGEILIQKEIPILEGKSEVDLNRELCEEGALHLNKLMFEILNKKSISKNVLAAAEIYINHVDYKSFPKKV